MQNGKTSRLIFGPPSEEETQQIRKSLVFFISEEAVNRLLEKNCLLLGRGRRNEVFVVSSSLWKLYELVQPRHPYFIGLFLGELKKGQLLPSLHVLHYLSGNIKPEAKIVTDNKGEQRFLYGQSLESSEFVRQVLSFEEPRPVVVFNAQGEGLGYGRLTKSGVKRQVKKRLDLGWYLRRGH
ncbi:MAG: NIP7 N-terminal domain-related protein [Promethearchaeota archaeon]